MIYLVVDIGNTLCKIALYENREVIEYLSVEKFKQSIIIDFIEKYGAIDAAIVSSTSIETTEILEQLKVCGVSKIENFSSKTPLPIKNCYKTPHTLGLDRIASAVAASQKFKKKDIIIFDLGTAITIDYVSKGKEFIGGNISMGLEMRFKALNHFTQRLPLISKQEFKSFSEEFLENLDRDTNLQEFNNFGTTTQSAIFYGVVMGICNEIEGYIEKNSEKVVFFTGGDALFFEKLIKIPIFVDWQATLNGLQVILERICIEKF